MTVEDLIKQLQTLPSDLNVYVGGGYTEYNQIDEAIALSLCFDRFGYLSVDQDGPINAVLRS